MEYVTKEDVDIIIFSNNEDFYQFDELKPFRLTYEETIDFILEKKLQSFIPHPYKPKYNSAVTRLGYEIFKRSIDRLGSVEISNTTYQGLYKILNRFPLNILFAKTLERIKKVRNLPKKDYPKEIKFLAAGSDAHYPEELGTYVSIDSNSNNLFKDLISNTAPQITYRRNNKLNYYLALKPLLVWFKEFLIKRCLYS